MTSESLEIPLKSRLFRQYRDVQVMTAGFLVFLLIATFGCDIYFINEAIASPTALDRSHRYGTIGFLLYLLLWTFFGSAMAWSVTRLVFVLNRTFRQELPALRFSHIGVEDNASDNPTGLVRWDQIEKITLLSRYKVDHPGVAILLKNNNRPKPGPMVLFFGLDLKLPVKQIIIRQDMIAKPAEEVVKLANDFRQQWVSEGS